MPATGANVVKVVGEYGSSCGYCHSEDDSSAAFGVMPCRLTVEAYQALLDRGWRRSGMWLYLPLNAKTCCVCYTHRLDVTKFTPSKAQRQALRRFQAFASGADPQGGSPRGASPPQTPKRRREQREASEEEAALAALISAAAEACRADGVLPPGTALPQPRVQPPSRKLAAAASLAFTSAVAFQIAAAARKAAAGSGAATPDPPQLAELLAARLRPAQPHVRAEAGHLNFYSTAVADTLAPSDAVMRPPRRAPAAATARDSEGCAVRAGRRAASGQEASGSAAASQAGPGASIETSRLEVRLVRSSPSLAAVEFPLYFKYQTRHHGESPAQVTPKSFRRFLLDSPLTPVRPEQRPLGGCPPCGFGSFHQQYWVDGVLIAVGVVDVLPGCLSSKYFFWDPDLAHLSLGKVGALLEIQWVAAAMRQCPGLRHYYMGYYIHTCPKMRYKVEFEPADLLCPRSLRWVPFAAVRAALDEGRTTDLAAVAPAAAEPPASDADAGFEPDRLRVRVPKGEPGLLTLGMLRSDAFLPHSILQTMIPNMERLVEYVGALAADLEVLLW